MSEALFIIPDTKSRRQRVPLFSYREAKRKRGQHAHSLMQIDKKSSIKVYIKSTRHLCRLFKSQASLHSYRLNEEFMFSIQCYRASFTLDEYQLFKAFTDTFEQKNVIYCEKIYYRVQMHYEYIINIICHIQTFVHPAREAASYTREYCGWYSRESNSAGKAREFFTASMRKIIHPDRELQQLRDNEITDRCAVNVVIPCSISREGSCGKCESSVHDS